MATARKIAPPRTVKVLCSTYRVRFVPYTEATAAKASGWCDFDRQEIVLSRDMVNTTLADTFHHEVMHAIGYSMGVDWDCEERVVGTMATGLTTFWQANPVALRWWSSLL